LTSGFFCRSEKRRSFKKPTLSSTRPTSTKRSSTRRWGTSARTSTRRRLAPVGESLDPQAGERSGGVTFPCPSGPGALAAGQLDLEEARGGVEGRGGETRGSAEGHGQHAGVAAPPVRARPRYYYPPPHLVYHGVTLEVTQPGFDLPVAVQRTT